MTTQATGARTTGTYAPRPAQQLQRPAPQVAPQAPTPAVPQPVNYGHSDEASFQGATSVRQVTDRKQLEALLPEYCALLKERYGEAESVASYKKYLKDPSFDLKIWVDDNGKVAEYAQTSIERSSLTKKSSTGDIGWIQYVSGNRVREAVESLQQRGARQVWVEVKDPAKVNDPDERSNAEAAMKIFGQTGGKLVNAPYLQAGSGQGLSETEYRIVQFGGPLDIKASAYLKGTHAYHNGFDGVTRKDINSAQRGMEKAMKDAGIDRVTSTPIPSSGWPQGDLAQYAL